MGNIEYELTCVRIPCKPGAGAECGQWVDKELVKLEVFDGEDWVDVTGQVIRRGAQVGGR